MIPVTFYHIYNRGNNKQPIFLKRENYLFFLNKLRKHLLPHLHIVAYCLMTNHFHILAYTKEDIEEKKFSADLKIMLSSYTRAINVQEGWTGSLFQQRTKKKPLEEILVRRLGVVGRVIPIQRMSIHLFASTISIKTRYGPGLSIEWKTGK